jgi:C-terminal peptidase prc
MSGDIISAINGESVQGMTLNQAVDKMRGQVNTTVKLTILRGSARDSQEVAITRAVIQIRSVRFRQEGDDIGYIRITQFNEQTYDGVKNAISRFTADMPGDKLRGYVLDLRNNPGGLLDQAVQVTDDLLDQGEIVSTRARRPEDAQRWNARAGDITQGLPMVVLINGGSASASSISRTVAASTGRMRAGGRLAMAHLLSVPAPDSMFLSCSHRGDTVGHAPRRPTPSCASVDQPGCAGRCTGSTTPSRTAHQAR